MKRGSQKRVCHYCGKTLLWLVPTGKKSLGLTEYETKKVSPCKFVGMHYACLDCYEAHKNDSKR